MPSFDPFPGTLPFSIEEIEEKFYELEFSKPESKMKHVRQIASKIPWQYSLIEIIDSFKDPTLRISGRQAVGAIHIERTNTCLVALGKKGNASHYNDLEQGVFLLSGMGDFYTSYREFKAELDRLAYRLDELFELNKAILTDDVKVHLLSRVLFQEEGFMGNQKFYNDPDNSYITKVLKTKMGIPISLSAVYLLIANRLNLPVYGTNMPLHFILQYESETYSTYIDPFHGGVLLERDTCEKFLNSNGYKVTSHFFAKTSTLNILKRMYRNLIQIYKQTGPREMETILTKQLSLLESKQSK
ncbi:MAG: transglutaminase-like domain-containing protein [Leptospira sp.]|nr:transglutaminase-like domain-containing protein [Leptospira sp.]